MIIVVNDNIQRLESWKRKLNKADVKAYSHPNYLLQDLSSSAPFFSNVEYYVFDRYFYGRDLLSDDLLADIKQNCPNKNAKFLLSSANHDKGDQVDGFDFVLSRKPISIEEIEEICNKKLEL